MSFRTLVVSASASLALAIAMTARIAGQDAPAPGPSGEGLPDGAGKDVTVKVCGVCHEARRVGTLRLTRDGWSEVIADMVRRGARGSDQELGQVLDYVAANFLGEAPRPVNINTAESIELETVVGLLRRESAALIAYREKNGPFKSIDDVKNVKGVDFAKIEAARDRIVCY